MIDYKAGNYGFLNLDYLENMPFSLLDTGIEMRQNEKYVFDNQNRPNYNGFIIQYTLHGQGIYEFEGKRYLLGQTHGFFTKIPEESKYYLPIEIGKENQWEFLYLHISGDAVDPFYRIFQKEYGPVFSLPLKSSTIQSYLAFQDNLRKGYLPKKYETGEFTHRFLCSLLRELENQKNHRYSNYVDRAIILMEKEYNTLQSIEALAEQFSISSEHLSRIFKTETGISPLRYLTNVRIQHSLYFLLNTNLPIQEIALNCGFSCGNYFSKVFRKYLGVSPEDYRHFK